MECLEPGDVKINRQAPLDGFGVLGYENLKKIGVPSGFYGVTVHHFLKCILINL